MGMFPLRQRDGLPCGASAFDIGVGHPSQTLRGQPFPQVAVMRNKPLDLETPEDTVRICVSVSAEDAGDYPEHFFED